MQVVVMVTQRLIGGVKIHMMTMTLTAVNLILQRYINVLEYYVASILSGALFMIPSLMHFLYAFIIPLL